jgi:hypothetical protein
MCQMKWNLFVKVDSHLKSLLFLSTCIITLLTIGFKKHAKSDKTKCLYENRSAWQYYCECGNFNSFYLIELRCSIIPI